MRPHRISLTLAAAALAFAGAADAYTCYFILDAKDVVIYRHVVPPVDMSERGAAEREALRRSGQLLLIAETDRCVPLGFGSGWATSGEAPTSAASSNVQSITGAAEGAVSRAPGIPAARPTTATPAQPAAPATRPRAPTSSGY